MIAIDANVFIYSFDNAVPDKHLRAVDFLAQLLHRGATPVLMWQVACETLGWLRRRKSEGRFSADEIAQRFETLTNAYSLAYPCPGILERSFQLQVDHSLSHWDSLLLAACISAGIDTLYSEDMSHGMTYNTVTVISPFQSP